MASVLASVLGMAVPVQAQSVGGEVRLGADEDGLALSYLLLKPELSQSLGERIEATVSLRIEAEGSRTGLGTRRSFSPISAPIIKGEDVRAEIGEAYLTIYAGSADITLGKQIIAWGALDGARVTDTVNPVRLTEGLARDPRPDRIPIWALRLRGSLGPIDYDLLAAPDPTVNQQPLPDDAFFPAAPRLRAGLAASAALPPLNPSDRGRLIEDGTLGARLSLRMDAADLRLSVVSAPDHDGVPVFDGQQIELQHDRRHTIGAEFVRQFGGVVARFETAWTPDARFNLAGTMGTETIRDSRLVAGFGADFSGPLGTYVNAQLIVDHVITDAALERPDTDVISTLRIMKDFDDDTHAIMAEWLSSISDGDGLVRLEVTRRLNEAASVFVGANWFYGAQSGLFGQFSEQSRVLSGLRFDF